MAKKSIKPNLKSKSTYEEQLMVLVENMHDEIKLVAEGNLMLGERMERGFADVDKRFDEMERRMDIGFEKVWDKIESMDAKIESMDAKIESMDAKIASMEKDMQSSFKTVVECLSRIEDEIAEIKIELKRLEEKKADKEVLIAFEKRLARIERELEEHKNLCKNR
ncbi:MAG: hypothetical protein WCX69_06085 [Candidatus Paceibacterota bacterium]